MPVLNERSSWIDAVLQTEIKTFNVLNQLVLVHLNNHRVVCVCVWMGSVIKKLSSVIINFLHVYIYIYRLSPDKHNL